ncbi:MAG: hypothetical protein ACOCXS_03445 [Bacteroidota bacterium]
MENKLNTWPKLAVDRQALLFGAATHDIGKAIIQYAWLQQTLRINVSNKNVM